MSTTGGYSTGGMAQVPRLPKVYLAGGLDSGWREVLANRWDGKAICIDPFKDSSQGAIYEFTHDDLKAIRESDVVFGVCSYPKFDGMALEFGYAHALGIPIIYATNLPRVSSMMAAVSKAVFTDYMEAVEFIEKRYLG